MTHPICNAAEAARQFNCELFDSVEILGDIAREHGVRTLTDLMYLQDAILTNGFIDAWEADSHVIKIVSELPSAQRWTDYITEYNNEGSLVRKAKYPLEASADATVDLVPCALCKWPEASREATFCESCLPHVEPIHKPEQASA